MIGYFSKANEMTVVLIHRGDTLRFTLWNEKARSFNIEEYEKEPKPTVMAVTSCWVKTYGGNFISTRAHTE